MKLRTLKTIALLLAVSPAAHATLGETEASIATVQQRVRGSRRPVVRATRGATQYTIHEVVVAGPNGMDATSVREYVRADGIVFGIAWRGYRTPDTKLLLGRYQPEFQKLVNASPRKKGLRQHLLQSRAGSTHALIIARGGHPRALRGRFIAPTLLPAGVSANDIQ